MTICHGISSLQRPPRAARISPLEKERLIYKEFDTLDGALSWARHVSTPRCQSKATTAPS
jgi:hypothetical protein